MKYVYEGNEVRKYKIFRDPAKAIHFAKNKPGSKIRQSGVGATVRFIVTWDIKVKRG